MGLQLRGEERSNEAPELEKVRGAAKRPRGEVGERETDRPSR